MSRLAEVQKKYPSIDWNVYQTYDISGKNKYLDWIGKNADAGEALKDMIASFEKRKNTLEHKDIYKYTSETLREALDKLGKSRSEKKEAGIVEVGTVNGARIILMDEFDGASTYMAKTRWCISNKSTFENYARTKNLYIAIKDNQKVCIVVNLNSTSNSVQLYEAQDAEFSYILKNISNFTSFNGIVDKCLEHSNNYKNTYAKVNNYINMKNTNELFEKLSELDSNLIKLILDKKAYRNSIYFKNFLSGLTNCSNDGYKGYVKDNLHIQEIFELAKCNFKNEKYKFVIQELLSNKNLKAIFRDNNNMLNWEVAGPLVGNDVYATYSYRKPVGVYGYGIAKKLPGKIVEYTFKQFIDVVDMDKKVGKAK